MQLTSTHQITHRSLLLGYDAKRLEAFGKGVFRVVPTFLLGLHLATAGVEYV